MKYAILVGDGMADFPIEKLGNKTPLEYACTPAMDTVAAEGLVGRVRTVPSAMPPGSDVANMSLLGYDPADYYTGRAPIEAASMGVPLAADDVAFRCNLVTLGEGLMQDYSAGHIDTADAHALVGELGEWLGSDVCRFFRGVSYRHLLVLTGFRNPSVETTPPHDITGKPWEKHLPQGEGGSALVDLMAKARAVLAASETNRRRVAEGKRPATDIWLWGQGTAMQVPTLKDRYGLSGSVVSAVDLVRGLGVLAAMRVRLVEGATGYLGTNYAGKVAAATEALAKEDLVFLHVEAPDETSHEGSLEKKVQAIEEFDRHVVSKVLDLRTRIPELRLLVAPDHATPISLKTHHADPVPFAVCGAGIRKDPATCYCEQSAANAPEYTGKSLFDAFVKGSFQ